MGIIGTAIKEKLERNFNPSQLQVIDESAKHAHHRGAQEHSDEGGSAESHFHVIIHAEALQSLGRLARHRAVLDALKDEISKIHAFSVEINPH